MKLGLVIDLDTCVGCHACAVACKQWNTSGTTGPLSDYEPYGKEPSGVWFNRIRHYEVDEYPHNKTINTPMSCMHCDDAACVTVCPTGASYKREEDGIVLVDQSKCMGCNLCVNLPEEDRKPACVLTCPTSARFFGDFDDPNSEVSTLVRERGGYAMMPEVGYNPVNRYLPPRERPTAPVASKATDEQSADSKKNTQSLLGKWLQKQKSAFDSLGER